MPFSHPTWRWRHWQPLAALPHWRVRATLLLVLGAVGLMTAGLLWRLNQLELQRRTDHLIASLAKDEAQLSQQLGRAALLAAQGEATHDAAAQLAQATLARSQRNALLLENHARQQVAISADSQAALAQSLNAWQAARERLWYRAELTLRQIDASEPALLLAASAALQREVEPTALAAMELAERATGVADHRRHRALTQLTQWSLGLLAMLLLLGVAVGEPTVRAVRRQHQQLSAQAQGLAHLGRVASHTSHGMAITNGLGHVLWHNAALGRLPGNPSPDLTGRPLQALLAAAGADAPTLARVDLALQQDKGLQAELRGHDSLGRARCLQLDLQPVREGRGPVPEFVLMVTDITEQRHQQAVLSHTVEAAGLGTWQLDLRTGQGQYNERLARMLGYQPDDPALIGNFWGELVHPDDQKAWRAALREHLANPATPCRADLRVRRPDGEWALVQSCGVVIEHGADGSAWRMAGINIDMTEQVQMQAMLRHAALTDGLTQLPNRAAVFDQVQQVIDRAGRQPGRDYAVLFMDFDRFKQVNDTLGHGAGDELLRQIAQRLRTALRATDEVAPPGAELAERAVLQHTAGRIGGDEFVVVLEQVNGTEGACTVARRLIEVLAAPYQIGQHTVHSTASIGIVASSNAATDAHTVMRDADTAMYEAKRAGRGRFVVFDPAMHDRVADRMTVEADLRQALAGQQLFVVYQPVVDLQRPGASGVEALVRWRHPTRGLVPPLQFIPVAEESGLIVELGQFVLQTACHQSMAWRAQLGAQAPDSLAVNLSAAQLRWPGLVAMVRGVLQDSGMPAQALQLEVTESLAAQDETARAKLRELKALGVRVALDDFGTGYSSLACLHQLPVDTVKIDRSFVMHAQTSEYHRVLIEATIRVAETLGMDTVAEGIETDGQAKLMQALRCSRGQGFLFSKPLDAAALAAWVQARGRAPVALTPA